MAKKAYVYTGSAWVDLASSVADLSNYVAKTELSAAGKNAIINGDFKIAQRGTSFTCAAGSEVWTLDRWSANRNGSGTLTVSQQTFTPGTAPVVGYEGTNYIRIDQTVAGTGATFNVIQTKLEDVRLFAGQTVTLSFWAKTDSAKTYSATIRQNFGSGGSASVDTNTSNFTTSTSWTRYSFTVSIPSISGKTIGTYSFLNVWINLNNNATQTLDLWGVQLEAGSIATAFSTAMATPNAEIEAVGSHAEGVLVSTNLNNLNAAGNGNQSWAGYSVAGKNKLLNGDFGIWQRGTSFSLAASSSSTYSSDRWVTGTGTNQAVTISRQPTGDTTNLPNIQYCLRYQRNSGQTGTATLTFAQCLETVNSIPLAGKTVTLSFYARAGANFSGANLAGFVSTSTGTDQNILSAWAGSANALTTYPVLSTTWQRFSATGTVPSTATQVAAAFQFTPTGTAGVNDYFEITGVQLEIGSTATPFSTNTGNYGSELAACQRYYYRNTSNGQYIPYTTIVTAATTTSAVATIQVPVPMRMNPTPDSGGTNYISAYAGGANYAITAITSYGAGNNPNIPQVSLTIGTASLTAGNKYDFISANSTSSYLGLSAELQACRARHIACLLQDCKMQIAVYAIALNEAKHAERFIQGCQGADLVVVADTGSTDGTAELLTKLGATVHQIKVEPFRFDDARNTALALVPADVDICVSLDLDEVPDEGFFDKLRQQWQPDTDRAWVMWDTGSIWANNNRVHRRHGYRWIKPCHEVTTLSRKRPESEIVVEALVHHKPDNEKPRTQYLDMLEWAVEEDPHDARMLAYLAREYYFHSRWGDVIETAGRLYQLDAGWNIERSATWRNCGFAFQQLGDLVQAEEWYRRSVEEAPDQLDAWFAYAQFMYTQERWQECFDAASKVLELKPDTHYLADDSMPWRMYDLLGIAAWNLGKKGSAKKYARIATELNPDDERLKGNLAFMVSNLVKGHINGVQDGLSNPEL